MILNIYYFYQYYKLFDLNILLNLLLFLPSIEIIQRMLNVNIMPYETGKYMCLLYFIIFSLDKRIHSKKINSIFIVMLIFLFPSFLFMDLDNFRIKIVFNLLGIVNMSLLSIFFSRITITLDEFKALFKNFIYSILPVIVILFIKTPKFSEIKFDLGANFETSGGFGPNQVSTLLGSVILILIIHQIALKTKLFKSNRLLDLLLIIIFSFRALLTFSRGGIFAPIAALILPINLLAKVQNIQKIIGNLFLIIVFLILSFLFANNLTNGILLFRFTGVTDLNNTTSEKSLEGISTGRASIVESDINLWLDNFIFGVGPGESPYKRAELGKIMGQITHTEFSRLLSEHGLFGLVINFIIIIIIPFKIINSKIGPQIKYIKLTFIFFALLSMGHSAMRTVIPVIFYAFAAVNFYEGRERKERIKVKG